MCQVGRCIPCLQAAAVHSSTDRTQQKDATATSTSSAIKRQSHQQNDGGEQRPHRVSSEVATSLATTGRGGPETAQVTFQEPLESTSLCRLYFLFFYVLR